MSRGSIYRQITKLSNCRMANHPLEEKTHDSSQKNDGHNRMDSPRFHVVEIFPKWKSFNATHHIKHIHILQPILELRPKSVRHRFVIHADNAILHTAKQSQECCEQNSLKITLHPPYSSDLTSLYFSIQICEALSEETFLSFGKSTSWHNSYNFQKSLWRPHSGTGWRDWFESPHTKIMTIHKVNPGLFIFVQSHSGTEVLNPRGTPYIFPPLSAFHIEMYSRV
jgi:hypothetical protein